MWSWSSYYSTREPMSTDRGGNTPLHVAAFKGHAEVAELLIAKGARKHAY